MTTNEENNKNLFNVLPEENFKQYSENRKQYTINQYIDYAIKRDYETRTKEQIKKNITDYFYYQEVDFKRYQEEVFKHNEEHKRKYGRNLNPFLNQEIPDYDYASMKTGISSWFINHLFGIFYDLCFQYKRENNSITDKE